MSNISQSGTYRGTVIDRGLSESSGGHLQLEVTLQAIERYNEEAQVWEPFSYEDSEAQAYLNLITSKEKENPVNCRQIMRAFGWDGTSWAALNDTDNDLAKQIQWRMGMETYNDVERCKVQGISAYDASPGRQVERLDAAKVRALDAKYAGILKSLGGGPKPKTAKPKAPPAVQATPAGPDPAPPVAEAPKPAAKKRGRPATPKAAPAPSTDAKMDQETAWATYADKAQAAGKSDLEIQNTWIAVIVEKFGGDEKNVGDNWFPVATEAMARLGL